jgi:hypothetical protein
MSNGTARSWKFTVTYHSNSHPPPQGFSVSVGQNKGYIVYGEGFQKENHLSVQNGFADFIKPTRDAAIRKCLPENLDISFKRLPRNELIIWARSIFKHQIPPWLPQSYIVKIEATSEQKKLKLVDELNSIYIPGKCLDVK